LCTAQYFGCPFAAIGVRLTGVDNATYSLTGESYSTVVPPTSVSTASRILQQDDVALAYEFSRKVSFLRRSTQHRHTF
jgi:hypothetical protein